MPIVASARLRFEWNICYLQHIAKKMALNMSDVYCLKFMLNTFPASLIPGFHPIFYSA